MSFEITSDHAVGHWTAKQLDGGYFEERSRAIGLAKDGEIIAGVVGSVNRQTSASPLLVINTR